MNSVLLRSIHAPLLVKSAAMIALAGWLCAVGGCSRDRAVLDPDVAHQSHQRMVQTLQEVAQQALIDNEYFNAASQLPPLRTALTDAITTDDLVEQLELHKQIGLLELNLGESTSACDHLAQSCELVPIIRDRQLARISDAAHEDLLMKTAVAHLRLGEDQNCVHCTNGTSCILPIAAAGIHQQPRGSRQATQYLQQVLQINPQNPTASWLLNIAAMTLGNYPDGVPAAHRIDPERFESQTDFPRFANIAASLGLDTFSHSGGAIADDFDGDGWLDVVVSDWNPAGAIRFFHNDGDGSFSDQTAAANLTGITGGLNIVQADYDNDGDLDVLVLRGAWLGPDVGSYPNSLLQNDGRGRFTDVTFAVGLGEVHAATQTGAWSDFDLDGDLDLYIGNEFSPNQLFENVDGKFTDIAAAANVLQRNTFTKGVGWGDVNGDRWPDLYVSNLRGPNALYLNDGDGTFTDVTRDWNAAAPQFSFATWFWDYNNDGALDLFVGSYQVGVQYVALDYLGAGSMTETDHLYENTAAGPDGKQGFREVGQQRGLTAVTQPMGGNFGDLDNDGFLDFYLGTGYPDYDGLMPNLMYRNDRAEKFQDVTFAGGFGHLQKGHGVAFADFDHDGDQDVLIEMGGAYAGDAFENALFENPGFDHHWIKIRLRGTQSNRCAIGTRLKLTIAENGQSRSIYRWVGSGGSFGGNPLRQEIGLGDAERIERLEVYWPASDQTQVFTDLTADQSIEISEGDSTLKTIPIAPVTFVAR